MGISHSLTLPPLHNALSNFGMVCFITDAARTYFVSMVGADRLKSSGKYATKCVKQRRRNRIRRVSLYCYNNSNLITGKSIMQKLNSRSAALAKTRSLSDSDRSGLKVAVVPCLMSSEESDEDGSFTIRPLPWRSDKVNRLFKNLDSKHEKKQSRKSKMMTSVRKEGDASDRPQPAEGSVPAWCLQ